jgi:hypothetical protein
VHRFFALIVMSVALLVSAGAAWAGNGPSNSVYDDPAVKLVKAAKVTAAVQPAVAAVQPAQASETLPFTGMDLSIALIGGVALLGTGVALRRASRRRD